MKNDSLEKEPSIDDYPLYSGIPPPQEHKENQASPKDAFAELEKVVNALCIIQAGFHTNEGERKYYLAQNMVLDHAKKILKRK